MTNTKRCNTYACNMHELMLMHNTCIHFHLDICVIFWFKSARCTNLEQFAIYRCIEGSSLFLITLDLQDTYWKARIVTHTLELHLSKFADTCLHVKRGTSIKICQKKKKHAEKLRGFTCRCLILAPSKLVHELHRVMLAWVFCGLNQLHFSTCNF